MNRNSWVCRCALGAAAGLLMAVPSAHSYPVRAPTNQVPAPSVDYGKDGAKGGNVEFEWKVEEGESIVVPDSDVILSSALLSSAMGGAFPPTAPGVVVESFFDIEYGWDWLIQTQGTITNGHSTGTAASNRLFVGNLSFDSGGSSLYDTELVELHLVALNGLPPGISEMRLRESPTRQSLGKTSNLALPGGGFRVDSFFDVFFELSLDGGANWVPASGPLHIESFPEPSTCILTALGLVGIAAGSRRRNR
jgi:hypothetical protein